MAEVPWQAEVAEWIDSCLARRGLERTAAVEAERVRPRGTVLRAPSSAGTVWLKAPGAATRFEVPLHGLLAIRAPERVLEPLGADLERGWVPLPSGLRPGPGLAARRHLARLDLTRPAGPVRNRPWLPIRGER